MKNILHEKPVKELSGRLAASVLFVDDVDVKNKTVLDIGCGYGWCELNFLDMGVKEIVGMEISEQDLCTIKNTLTDSKLKLAVGSAIDISFPSNVFDTVVSWEVLEHIPKNTESKMFSEVYRILKPGGVFYLSTPHSSFWTNALDPAWWLIGHRHYSSQDIKQFGEEAGFTAQIIEIKGGWWMMLNMLNFYFSKWILRRNILYKDFFSEKENEEYSASYHKGFTNLFVKFVKN